MSNECVGKVAALLKAFWIERWTVGACKWAAMWVGC